MFDIMEAAGADYPQINKLAEALHDERPLSVKPVRQASRTFVSRLDGAVVGFAICTLTEYGISNSGQLEEIAVAESQRGGGLGRALAEACEAWLRREGAEVIFVSALIGAEAFYEAMGYRRCVGPWLFRSLDPDR